MRQIFAWASLIGSLTLLAFCHAQTVSEPKPKADPNGQPNVEQISKFKARQLIEDSGSLNLNTILTHQTALEEECAKFYQTQLNQLNLLYRQQANPAQPKLLLNLPEPLRVKVPAVCLFIFNQYEQPSKRVELVNWIYDGKELAANAEADPARRADNMTKRQAVAEESELLADYLLDPAAASPLANQVETEQEMELHRNIDQALKNDKFKQLIDVNRAKMAAHLSPVILIPGLLGSRLQVRTNKQGRVNILCSKQSDWQDVWLSIRQLLPLVVDCWLDNVRLEYNAQSGFSQSPAGVESRVPDFGSVESVRHLDVRQPKISSYFEPLIERYEQLGYTADLNLLAAPYDFRLAPQELQANGYFADLKQLIERAQLESPSNKLVTLVCHSMGCTHLYVFLRMQSAAWRQAHVRKLIALSSPWGGSAKALKALLVGDQLELPLVSEMKMRKLARTYPSIAFLLPQPEIFGRPNRNQAEAGGPVLVQTPQRAYKVADIAQLLQDLKLDRQLNWFKQTSDLIKPLEPLKDLNVDCIYSLNTPTPEALIFQNQTDFPDGDYQLIKGEGDGTVNFQSLIICDQWARQLPERVRVKVIMNTNHIGVISHKTTLTHLTDDVLTN